MIEIGIRRADITPPVGVPLVGFAGRGPSTGVNDPLTATAFVASDGTKKVAIVACDLLGVNEEFTSRVRSEVADDTDIAPTCLMIACSHTHYGPNLLREVTQPDEVAYHDYLVYRIAGMVAEAARDLRPAVLSVGYGSSDIGINRRERHPDGSIWLGQNPDGPVDRTVGVCRIDHPEGGLIAVLAHFATHPVSQTGAMRNISADFPGQMRSVVETVVGAPCLFLQGACGNINPVKMVDDWETARTLGTRLGCEVARVCETTERVDASGVAAAELEASLPSYTFGSAARASELVEELTAELETVREEDGGGAAFWIRTRLGRARAAAEAWSTGSLPPPVVARIQAIRIGEVSFVGVPGEIFCQIGTAVRDAAVRDPERPAHTFFAGYANGSIGYVPVPEAYDEGGYEVTHACRVDPGAAEIVTETSRRALEAVRLA